MIFRKKEQSPFLSDINRLCCKKTNDRYYKKATPQESEQMLKNELARLRKLEREIQHNIAFDYTKVDVPIVHTLLTRHAHQWDNWRKNLPVKYIMDFINTEKKYGNPEIAAKLDSEYFIRKSPSQLQNNIKGKREPHIETPSLY